MFCRHETEEVKETCTWQKVSGKRKREMCLKGKESQTFASYSGREIRPRVPVCLKNSKRMMWESQQFYSKFCFMFCLLCFVNQIHVRSQESGEYFSELTEGTGILPATVNTSRKPTKQNSD